MSDATRRGLRTALQMILAALSTGAVVGLLNGIGINVSVQQWAGIATVATPFVTALQNWLEDNDTIPALLKAPASNGADPIPPAGTDAGGIGG